jgi:hypothetical protein
MSQTYANACRSFRTLISEIRDTTLVLLLHVVPFIYNIRGFRQWLIFKMVFLSILSTRLNGRTNIVYQREKIKVKDELFVSPPQKCLYTAMTHSHTAAADLSLTAIKIPYMSMTSDVRGETIATAVPTAAMTIMSFMIYDILRRVYPSYPAFNQPNSAV